MHVLLNANSVNLFAHSTRAKANRDVERRRWRRQKREKRILKMYENAQQPTSSKTDLFDGNGDGVYARTASTGNLWARNANATHSRCWIKKLNFIIIIIEHVNRITLTPDARSLPLNKTYVDPVNGAGDDDGDNRWIAVSHTFIYNCIIIIIVVW